MQCKVTLHEIVILFFHQKDPMMQKMQRKIISTIE
jgi:hypothetical protein